MISCGNSDDAPEAVSDFRLSEISARLDGNDIASIPITTSTPEISGSTFNYNSEDGLESGTWEINEDKTALKVAYETESFEYPLLSYSSTEFSFVIESIDLKGTFTEKDQNVILLINQKLLATNKSWSSVASSSQLLEIIFTFKNK